MCHTAVHAGLHAAPVGAELISFFPPSYGSCMLFLNISTRVNKIADKLPTDSIFTTQNSHTEFISSSRTSWKCEADEACAHACVQTNRQSC